MNAAEAVAKTLLAALHRVEVVHGLSEDQKRCAADGPSLKLIGEEIPSSWISGPHSCG
jgi:hypothetical protein